MWFCFVVCHASASVEPLLLVVEFGDTQSHEELAQNQCLILPKKVYVVIYTDIWKIYTVPMVLIQVRASQLPAMVRRHLRESVLKTEGTGVSMKDWLILLLWSYDGKHMGQRLHQRQREEVALTQNRSLNHVS